MVQSEILTPKTNVKKNYIDNKVLVLWWFFLFYVLVFKIFCAVGALCMFSYF